uniref:Uncharacterized protein n=1 Tax=Ceratitis capitata TaxID=7213 RepID=W8C752_CERCA
MLVESGKQVQKVLKKKVTTKLLCCTMLTEAQPVLVEACGSTAHMKIAFCNCENNKENTKYENNTYNSNQHACHTYNTRAISYEKRFFSKKFSLLLGVRSSNQVKCVLTRELCFFHACRRRRKRRKTKSVGKKNTNNNINNKCSCNMRTTSARYCKIRRRKRILRWQITSGGSSCFDEATRTTSSLMLADYIDNGMLQARNNNCLRTEARATTKNAVATQMMPASPPPTKTTIARLMIKLVKRDCWLGKRRLWAALSRVKQKLTRCNYMLSPVQQQQQQRIQQQLPTPATANALSCRLPTDGEQMPLEGQARTHEQHKLKQDLQLEQQQQHCLLQTQQQHANNVQHRSWRNLIGCAAASTFTPLTVTNLINTITTITNNPTTKTTNSSSPAALVTAKICTQKIVAQATVDITDTRTTTATTTNKIAKSFQFS